MAVMLAASQLHEKSAFSIHAHLGSPTTGLLWIHGRTRPGGRVLLVIIQSKAYAASWLNTTLETCGSISEVASFSSSLKFYVFMDSVSGWRLLCLLCAQYTTSHAVAAITKFVKLVRVKNDPDKAKNKEARLEKDGGRKRA